MSLLGGQGLGGGFGGDWSYLKIEGRMGCYLHGMYMAEAGTKGVVFFRQGHVPHPQ